MRGLACLALLVIGCGNDDGKGPPVVDAGLGGSGGDADTSPPKVAFVTSTEYTAVFSSAGEADGLCLTRASEAGLPGTFRAWLSDATSSPSTRFTRPDGNYVRPGGTVIAHGWAGLTATALKVSLDYDEFDEETLMGFDAWTGTHPDGTPSGQDCTNWTGKGQVTYGDLREQDQRWTKMPNAGQCSGFKHLYCFEQ
ncbi:MAG: hypothetical protein IT377_29195 [Polyangiaceae bacterium]|nr:hypothetical protein [Polyangiaceae bacterium]